MDSSKTKASVEAVWAPSVVPTLEQFIAIPNLSPLFDEQWATNGLLEKAAELLINWTKSQNVAGANIELIKLEGKTPLIFIEVAASDESAGPVLLYGHYDKQPPFEGWSEGLGPYTPVIRNGRLYGRGAADDGYAIFSAITAIKSLQDQGIKHGRYVIIVEGCEESGSVHLPDYINHLKARIGTPELIVCLDSGAGDYDRLWVTTSLRGIFVGDLTVKIIDEGVHSGDASGIVPDSFRILRNVLSRIEDPETGRILVPELHADIPKQRVDQTEVSSSILADRTFTQYPFIEGAKPVQADSLCELALNRTWRPQLAITGAAGLPTLPNAGNVLRPSTTVKLSMRVPPTVNPSKAAEALKKVLEADPPYGAKVTYNCQKAGAGWDAPAVAPWLEKSAAEASTAYFGQAAAYMGEGGSIPFMGMLGEMFPEAQFLITGVLGPNSNAHGPNEFFEINFAAKLTMCVANVLADHAAHSTTAHAAKKARTA